MPVFKKWNSRRIRGLWRHLSETRKQPLTQEERLGEGKDAHPQKILKYGRIFLKKFRTESEANGYIRITTKVSHHESPISIVIASRENRSFHPIGRIKIGFVNNGVVIEAIQGVADSFRTSEVNAIIRQPWPNRIIQTIEANARKQGMKKIYLRDPTTMYWYHHPLTGHELGSGAHEEAAGDVRQTMKNFYGIIAKRNGFKRISPQLFVKEL